MNGLGLAVAASPVDGEAGQTTWCGPLACPLAPTVEMLISPKLWFIFGFMLTRHSCDDLNLCCQKEIIKRVG